MTIPNVGAPLWPTDFQGCHVTAQYLNLHGLPMAGSVTFVASPNSMLDAAHDLIIVPEVFTAPLDAQGKISIVLPATDDQDINPWNFTYAVSENFAGGRKYSIKAPQNMTVDLVDVSPVPSNQGQAIVRGPKGDAGGIQMVNGQTGDVVILTAADIGAEQEGAAAVVSVNSLQRVNNLVDLADQTQARANLGLSSVATLAPSAVAQTANNLSDLTNAATARTNLGVVHIPVGGIIMWSTDTAPTNFFICDGTTKNRITYATLYAVIGTSYGVGNGSSTFNLPNFTDRFPMGSGGANSMGIGNYVGTNFPILEVDAVAHMTFSATGSTLSMERINSIDGAGNNAGWTESDNATLTNGSGSNARTTGARVLGTAQPQSSSLPLIPPAVALRFIIRYQ